MIVVVDVWLIEVEHVLARPGRPAACFVLSSSSSFFLETLVYGRVDDLESRSKNTSGAGRPFLLGAASQAGPNFVVSNLSRSSASSSGTAAGIHLTSQTTSARSDGLMDVSYSYKQAGARAAISRFSLQKCYVLLLFQVLCNT